MKKLILCILCLASHSLFAQEKSESDFDSIIDGLIKNNGKFDSTKTVNIRNLLFATGKSDLQKEDKEYLLTDVIPYIVKLPTTIKVFIEGHTDAVGNAKANQILSQARADAVKAFFIKEGIAETRINSVGFGSTKPIADNKTKSGQTKNRRVIIGFIGSLDGSYTIAVIGKDNKITEMIEAQYYVENKDHSISYRKSDKDPIVKLSADKIGYIRDNKLGTTYDPNRKSAGVIVKTNGDRINASRIVEGDGIISYKKSDTDAMVVMKTSEVNYIKQVDGTAYNPNTKESGTIIKKDGTTIKASYVAFDAGIISYRKAGEDAIVKLDSKEVSRVDYVDGTQIKMNSDAKVVQASYNEAYTKEKIDFNKMMDKIIKDVEEMFRGKKVKDSVNKNSIISNWMVKMPKVTRVSGLFNVGVIPLNVKSAKINFAYIDESPSKDNIQSTVNLAKKLIGYGLNVGLEWEINNKSLWRAYYQYGFNSEGATNSLCFGIGKLLGKNKRVRIGADLQLGSAFVKLGDIYQNDLFIQVNKDRFYSETVAVRYRNYFSSLHPYISFEKPINEQLSLRLSLGGAAGLHTRSALTFTGRDDNDKKVKASEKMTASNVSFFVNDVRSTNSKLFNILGPQVGFSIYYSLYKTK